MAGGDRRRSCAGHLPRRSEFWLRDRCFLSARSAKSLADLNPRAARDHQPQWLAQAPSADSAAAASPIISAAVFPFRSSSFRHAALLLMTPWRYKTTIVAGTVITVNPALVAYFLALASLTKSGTFRCRARRNRGPFPMAQEMQWLRLRIRWVNHLVAEMAEQGRVGELASRKKGIVLLDLLLNGFWGDHVEQVEQLAATSARQAGTQKEVSRTARIRVGNLQL